MSDPSRSGDPAFERERERSIFRHGYRYTLRDRDTTWPAAYESERRGHDKKDFIYRISKYGLQGELPGLVCNLLWAL